MSGRFSVLPTMPPSSLMAFSVALGLGCSILTGLPPFPALQALAASTVASA
jgi:hypothetical protein